MAETQAIRAWSPPGGVLRELVASAEQRAADLARASVTSPGERPPLGDAGRFPAALRGTTVGVIAELKRRSPSKGPLNERLSAPLRAAAYVAGGAAAISVLTEPTRFSGSIDDLVTVRASVSVPLLRKDFIVDQVQLIEARAAGADAVLLIARALAPARAADLAAHAAALGLAVLFEIRDESELGRAIDIPGCIVGVNARNLETLDIDPGVSERLIPLIPSDRVAVFESGVRGRDDVERAARLGADAVLVGSALSIQPNGERAVTALAGVPRVARG